MMRKTATFCALIALAVQASTPETAVKWETLGNRVDANGRPHYTQRFTVSGNKDFPRLGFNMFARKMQPVNSQDTLVEIFPGYWYIASPRIAAAADTVCIDIDVAARLFARAYAPDGLHRINADGTTSPVAYERAELTRPEQWSLPGKDQMPRGADIFARNQALNVTPTPGVYDVIPSFKKVNLTGGTSHVGNPVFRDVDHQNPEYYRITVRNDSMIVECRPDRQWAVMSHFHSKVLMPNPGQPLPNVEIENWPDFPWRGLHIDIARNFQTPETMGRVLELMVANGLNKLHFHITDDEAWRLEIKALPELTEVGSRRGYAPQGEVDYLYQIFDGDGNPDTMEGTANGYWTRQQYIDFIKLAHTLGIDVLPEIESPGHARAAIKAMEKRHRNGDSSYRLIHDGDTSRYTSAQSYHDNIMNPALPGPYKFMETVIDELIDIYREADVPLIGIHIGGDEVPRGGWDGSAVAQEFMREHGLANQHQLHGYFVQRISEMLAKRAVPMFGWEEIAVGYDDDFNRVVAPTVGGVNCWHATPDAAVKGVKAGYPVILSNVNRFYLDMMSSPHPEEQGLNWGGYVDEFDALGGYAAEMCPVDSATVPGRILGVQGQVWAETIRSPKQLYNILLPKMLGLAERGWNSTPTWSEAQFNAIIGDKELPVYLGGGVLSSRMRQPGIRIVDNMVEMNAPYRGGEIRYTTDGTEPTAQSTVYTEPFAAPANPADLRARYFAHGLMSLTTRL